MITLQLFCVLIAVYSIKVLTLNLGCFLLSNPIIKTIYISSIQSIYFQTSCPGYCRSRAALALWFASNFLQLLSVRPGSTPGSSPRWLCREHLQREALFWYPHHTGYSEWEGAAANLMVLPNHSTPHRETGHMAACLYRCLIGKQWKGTPLKSTGHIQCEGIDAISNEVPHSGTAKNDIMLVSSDIQVVIIVVV